ncbi:MAG: hypothetical protein Q7R66_15555 [Undibacterium sp.]|uniref:hypothetical protein n=1 Tax=Undibacterium sp. TaxID=1914977 RepID=UPI00271973A4|nr:hypothetical protein [Undibacterium sp.]MDO8653599.1 hypothetical protein [Undibacterium sp.]
MKNIKLIVVSSMALAILAACGGGDPVPAPTHEVVTTSAEGLWKGTTDNGRNVIGLVLDDESFWLLYSSPTNSNIIAGAIQGSSFSNNGSFASLNAIDFNLEGKGLLASILSVSYTQKQSFNGTAHYSAINNPTLAFTTNYSADYDQAPSLAAIAGTYLGAFSDKSGSESGTLTISSGGAVKLSALSGCTSVGTVSPRAKGNAYNLSLKFDGVPCSNMNSTVTGIGYFDSSTKRFYGLGLNSAHTDGFIISVQPSI